jgi:hypothetical protein
LFVLLKFFFLKDDSNKKPELKLDLPEILRVFLVDDWEAVTKNKQVCSLVEHISNLTYVFLACNLTSDSECDPAA